MNYGSSIAISPSGSRTSNETLIVLWPAGVSNPAVGIVSPSLIQVSLDKRQTHTQTVSLTLPQTGPLTDMVDVFLLFDDTSSFTFSSPIVDAAVEYWNAREPFAEVTQQLSATHFELQQIAGPYLCYPCPNPNLGTGPIIQDGFREARQFQLFFD